MDILRYIARLFGYEPQRTVSPQPKFYTEQEVQEAFKRYREHVSLVLNAAAIRLPEPMKRIAIFDDRSTFVYKVDQHPLESIIEPQEIDLGNDLKALPHLGMVGEIEEEFCMSEEWFHMRPRNNPHNKPVYEISIDVVLQALKNPFMAVSCHDKTTLYLGSVCRLEKQLEPHGKILVFQNTQFLAYEENDLFDGLKVHSVRFGL